MTTRPGPPARDHRGVAALAALRPALDALYGATEAPITARVRWHEIWSRCYPEWEPWLVTIGSERELDGAAAFARRTVGPFVRVVGLAHGTADEARFPVRSDAAATALADAVVAALAGLGRPWTLLVEQLPAACPVTDRLLTVLPHARELPGQGMPRVVVPPEGQLSAVLSRNARQAENKARNRLARDGHELQQRWLRSPEELTALVPAMSAVHRARDEQLGRVSDHDDAARARFYRDVFVEHAAAGEADVLALEIDGELAAYVGAFRDGRVLRVWDNRVSPAWADFSAGRLANHEAIRRVVQQDTYDVLDWMRGEEPYKLSSATEIVPTRYLEAWSSPLARAPYAVKDGLRRFRARSGAFDRAVARVRHLARRTNG